jgi:hypothetical protein
MQEVRIADKGRDVLELMEARRATAEPQRVEEIAPVPPKSHLCCATGRGGLAPTRVPSAQARDLRTRASLLFEPRFSARAKNVDRHEPEYKSEHGARQMRLRKERS